MTRFTLALAAAAFSSVLTAGAQQTGPEPVRIVFQGGRSLPLEALELKGNQFTVLTAGDQFTQGQTFATTLADHIYGDKPEALNRGVALLLMNDPVKSLGALEPLLVSQRVSAPVPGNFWVEAARASILGYASMGNKAKVDALAKELADATPDPGVDPILALANAMMLPVMSKIEVKLAAYNELINDVTPADVAAYASFFKAGVLRKAKRDAEALDSYLAVSTLYPTGSGILNGAAQLNASEFITQQPRRSESVALVTAAARYAKDTPIGDDAKKRLEGMK